MPVDQEELAGHWLANSKGHKESVGGAGSRSISSVPAYFGVRLPFTFFCWMLTFEFVSAAGKGHVRSQWGERALHVITPLNLKINLYFLIAGKG